MLDSRVDRLEATLQGLAAAQTRSEERLAALAARMETLAEAQRRTEEHLGALAEALAALTRRVDQLAASVDRLVSRVGTLVGDILELRYRQKAAGYFQRILRRIQLVTAEELERLADDAETQGILTPADHEELVQSDVVVQGRLRERGGIAHLVAEVSSIVDSRDVQRAARRAQLLERVVGTPVVAAVAGEGITEEADREADALKLWRILDGRAFPPGTSATR